jgi:cation transport ATPase
MKIPSGKGNPALLRQVADAFGQIPGIESVVVNETTGSLVLRYDAGRHDQFHDALHGHIHGADHRPTTEIDTLADKIEEEAEFLAEHSASARAVVDFFKAVDREIKIATNTNLDLKMVLAAGVIAVTVLEIGATAATPVWVTLMLFATNHYIELHQSPPQPARANARQAGR